MKTIHRYPINLEEEQEIYVNGLCEDCVLVRPSKQVLRVGTIRGIPSIWCLVDTNEYKTKIKLYLYGTGWSIPKDVERRNYLGSFIIEDTEIYHVFTD